MSLQNFEKYNREIRQESATGFLWEAGSFVFSTSIIILCFVQIFSSVHVSWDFLELPALPLSTSSGTSHLINPVTQELPCRCNMTTTRAAVDRCRHWDNMHQIKVLSSFLEMKRSHPSPGGWNRRYGSLRKDGSWMGLEQRRKNHFPKRNRAGQKESCCVSSSGFQPPWGPTVFLSPGSGSYPRNFSVIVPLA